MILAKLANEYHWTEFAILNIATMYFWKATEYYLLLVIIKYYYYKGQVLRVWNMK